jgi:hypothetical protein
MLVQEMIKKVKKLSENDLFNLMTTMYYAREGNINYYELLGIPLVMHVGSYNSERLIEIIYILAQLGSSSVACAKAASNALRPKILAQASAIQGSGYIEKPSVSGFLTGTEAEKIDLDVVKSMIFPELKAKSKKISKMDIKELYKTTKNPLFNFKSFLKLAWGYLKIFIDSNIKEIDTIIWGLMITLLNKHLSHINSNDIPITNPQYDYITQIQFYSEYYFKSMNKINVPRPLTDYSLHKIYYSNLILTE